MYQPGEHRPVLDATLRLSQEKKILTTCHLEGKLWNFGLKKCENPENRITNIQPFNAGDWADPRGGGQSEAKRVGQNQPQGEQGKGCICTGRVV